MKVGKFRKLIEDMDGDLEIVVPFSYEGTGDIEEIPVTGIRIEQLPYLKSNVKLHIITRLGK